MIFVRIADFALGYSRNIAEGISANGNKKSEGVRNESDNSSLIPKGKRRVRIVTNNV